jgi:hypothetical protein
METFDPASVVTTSRFIASGMQPFIAATELADLEMPVLLVRGDDPMHPAVVSDIYAADIRHCEVLPASTSDIPSSIGMFVERCVHTAV